MDDDLAALAGRGIAYRFRGLGLVSWVELTRDAPSRRVAQPDSRETTWMRLDMLWLLLLAGEPVALR